MHSSLLEHGHCHGLDQDEVGGEIHHVRNHYSRKMLDDNIGCGNCQRHHEGGGDKCADIAGDTSPISWTQSIGWMRAHDPAECPNHDHVDHTVARPDPSCAQARCDHSTLNVSTNVIVLARVNELVTMSWVNTVLALAAVLYLVMNVIGIILNSYDNECDASELACHAATTPQIFHNLEFWSTFIFNTLDLLALTYSPKRLSNQYQHPSLLKLVVLLNVGMSFCSCLLITINLEKFEVVSHEIEYLNEVTVAVFDMVILLGLIRGRTHQTMSQQNDDSKWFGLTFAAALSVAIVQLGVYNLNGWTADGDSKGERLAHYFEFAFGILTAGVAFWFTMDNRLTADQRLRAIMYEEP